MFAKPTVAVAAFALICLSSWPITPASAITVEVAKKCDSLVAKAFPPREVGNPAAGRTKGTAQDHRDYFKKCVTNDGKMDDAAPPPSPPPSSSSK